MPVLRTLYERSPVALQNAAVSWMAALTVRRRFGADFRRRLAAAEDRATWDAHRFATFRDQRLRAHLAACAADMPAVAARFAAAGLAPDAIGGLEDLAALPILSKLEMRQDIAGFRARSLPSRAVSSRQTSGSTGAALHFGITEAALREQWAIWWRYWGWHGITWDTWCGYFVGHPVVPASQRRAPYWRLSGPRRQIIFSSYHLSGETLPAYVAELRRRRPPWLHGYPSTLALLAGLMRDAGLDLGYRPRWITTGAENLLESQRDLVAEILGTRPRQHYGLAEGVANFSECEHGRLHVDEDFAAVEFPENPHGPGRRVVGTAFNNPAYGFVRYDTGDLVGAVEPGPCPCGRPGRLVTGIDGRLEDQVVLADGSRVGRLSYMFRELDCLREAQIRQYRPGELEVWLVKADHYRPQDDQRLERALRERLGDRVRITLVPTDRLPRSANGKLRLVVSHLEDGEAPPHRPAAAQRPGKASDDQASR